MLDNANYYLKKKAQELDLDRADALGIIQRLLDEKFPGKTQAKSLNNGVLKVTTISPVVASELRMAQAQLVPKFTEATTRPIQRLHIQITDLSSRD